MTTGDVLSHPAGSYARFAPVGTDQVLTKVGGIAVYAAPVVGNQVLTLQANGTSAYQAIPPPPFVPSDLSGLSIWLLADVGVTSSGGVVSAWNDQSGNAYNFSQATVANRPTIVAGVINGKPVIRFTAASSQFLRSDGTNAGTRVGGTAVSGRQYTYFYVLINNEGVAAGSPSYTQPGIMAEDVASGGGNWGCHIGNDKLIVYHWIGSDANTRPNISTGAAIQVRGQYDLPSVTLTGKTPSQTTTAAVASGATSVSDANHLVIGACAAPRAYFNGDIGEIVHYNRSLSAAEIAQVVAYLTARWGV